MAKKLRTITLKMGHEVSFFNDDEKGNFFIVQGGPYKEAVASYLGILMCGEEYCENMYLVGTISDEDVKIISREANDMILHIWLRV